ncbi:kxDL motif-containing protein CG10681 isoform X1 [Cydia pomonella]|uniref:kxDL motif-containing protein CG10681 isoform X1 n=1 Tax=Cydia pomonella TaxID=82600 RepID=UPI002ADDD335|nr:kxDL motif-containing protein CG10681 isoform X1 [Cydia pomonella]
MANETPESDFSIECFQNYTAPEVFVQGLAGMVDQTDVETIIRAQKNISTDNGHILKIRLEHSRLQRFEKTTEMLTNCNQLSASRLRAASTEFRKHTQLLLDMRKDLEFIFKKIRAIKTKLSTQYPEAYKVAVNASLANKTPIDEEFKPTEPHTESKMVATVSTETLKPIVSEDKKKKKEVKIKTPKEEVKKVRSSSSSETESASSGDDSSTDTG